MRNALIICATVLSLLGCGTPSDVPLTGTASSQYILSITDSIGVELGDSAYAFGAIADVEILPDGRFAVLDGTACNIRIYSRDGSHVSTLASRGTGPGELIHPFSLFNWGDGTLGVMDPYNGGLHRYDIESGEWLGIDLEVNRNIPVDPVITGDSTYVCFKTRFEIQDERIDATAMIAAFETAIEPSVVYWSKTVPWDPGNMGNLTLELFFYNSYAMDSETGRVFVAPFSEDRYEILCFDPDGSQLGRITKEHTPVPKTPEEIDEESSFIEFFLRSSEGNNPDLNYACDPWPNHLPVSGLFIGLDGNLWARRGGTGEMTFDIWNGELEQAGTASIPGVDMGTGSWEMVFGEDYALLWNDNPGDYQKIYILESD